MISGATNTVRLQVASLPDFIIMKAHALAGRDKPKDVYDLCYCLDEYPGRHRGCGRGLGQRMRIRSLSR